MSTVPDISNPYISYTYTSYNTIVNNIQTTVVTLTNMSFNYAERENNNTVATLPNEVTEIAENFADGNTIPSLKYITQLIIGQNVNHFRRGICKNWTRLTHLIINLQTGPTIDCDTGSFATPSGSIYNFEIPTSFQYSDMNTITMFSNEFSRNILLLLLSDVTSNIRTLNIINGSLTITNIVSGLKRSPRNNQENFSAYTFFLTSVSIPPSVTSIGESAFFTCSRLKSVSMPLVTNIGKFVFTYCIALTSVHMPSVISIGLQAFYQCTSLTSISMPLARIINQGAFDKCTALTSVSMPLVTSIGLNAFRSAPINIQSLQQLYYQGFTSIKDNAITYGLTSGQQSAIIQYSITGSTITRIPAPSLGSYYITIPVGITAITGGLDTVALSYLTSITFSNSLTTIGPNAFSGCSNLTSVVLPGLIQTGLASLGTNAFFNTPNVSQSSLQTMRDQGYSKTTLEAAGFTNVPVVAITYNLSPDLTVLNSILGVPSTNSFALITIPSSVTSINASALTNNIYLTALTIPSTVTSIGANAFLGCSGLLTLVLPDSPLVSLGANAFFGTNVSTSSLQDINTKGYTANNLRGSGFSAINLRNGGYSDILILAGGYIAGDLRLANYTVSDLQTVPYPKNDILAAGYTASDLRIALYTVSDLQTVPNNAYSRSDILAAGFSAYDLRIALYTVSDLRTANYPTTEIAAGGYTASDFFDAGGYTASDLQLYFSNSDLLAAGFTIVPVTPVTPIICFNEDSKILCFIDGEEKEILIQNIRNGHLVKTLYDGYKPVCMIGTSVIDNPGTNERIKNRLFICKKEKYPELNEDLIITGCHSILVDEITELQRQEIIVTMGRIFITDRKYRLNAILDDRAEPYNCSGKFNIYHIALENENYYSNYGIYANGLLVESCGQRAIKKFANMTFL